MCCSLRNSFPVNNKKSIFENNIKDGDNLLFFKVDKNYQEKEEELDEDDENNEEEEEKNKILSDWVQEFKSKKFLDMVLGIMRLKGGEKMSTVQFEEIFSLEGNDFKEFICRKFAQIDMETKEHNHKLIFSKTNID